MKILVANSKQISPSIKFGGETTLMHLEDFLKMLGTQLPNGYGVMIEWNDPISVGSEDGVMVPRKGSNAVP